MPKVERTSWDKQSRLRLYLARVAFIYTIVPLLICHALCAESTANGMSGILSRLRAFDAVYEWGVTVLAVRLGEKKEIRYLGGIGDDEDLPDSYWLPPINESWKLTMADDRGVVTVNAQEVPLSQFHKAAEAHKGRAFSVDLTGNFMWTPDYKAIFDIHRVLALRDGNVETLGDNGWVKFIRPDDTSSDLSLNKLLWSMGRGFSKYIREIQSVYEQQNGLIKCCGPGKWGTGEQMGRWELVVDPSADYMIRSARYSEPGDEKPGVEVSNAGTKSMDGRFAPETASWYGRWMGTPIQFAFQQITQKPDFAFLEKTHSMLFGPYQCRTDVHDDRMEPGSYHHFRPGEVYHSFPIIRETLVGRPFEGLERFGLGLSRDRIEGKMILVCFWDLNQRPSRYWMNELAKQVERLKREDVIFLTVQVSNIEKEVLNEWLQENGIVFPVGIVKDDWQKVRHEWAVKSLPWLILTDREHIVRANGFSLSELDQNMKATEKSRAGVR